MKPGDHLEAKLGSVSVDLLHVPGYSYWEVLRTKLHWRGSNVE
jgi:NAD kinase